jgi:hypothetical protein
VYQTSRRAGSNAGIDMAKSLSVPPFSARGFGGGTKYPISLGCSTSLMSKIRRPDAMNEHATTRGFTRVGMLQ